MRILQVVHAYPPQIGGIENHVYYLSHELSRLGNEVSVATTGKGKTIEEGISISRFRSLHAPGFSSVRITPFLCLRLLGNPADIYHSHGYGSLHPLQTAITAKLKGKPFIFTLHGYPKRSSFFGNLFIWLYRNLMARIYLSIASKVISVTDQNLPEIRKEVSQDKILVIPNGVDTDSFKPSADKKDKSFNVVFIGRFDRDKGVLELIDAFAELAKKVENARLTFVGSDEGVTGNLKSRAAALGISERISFSSARRAEMPAVYASADLVVLPSYYEGLSLVLLEALASCRPIIATSVGATPQVFAKAFGENSNWFLVPPKDTAELAKKLIYAHSNYEKLASLLPGARAVIVKEYSWAAVAKQTLKVYEAASSNQSKR